MTFFLLLTEAAIRLTFLPGHVNRIFLLSLPAIRKKGISIKTQKETGCKQPISGLILRSVNFYFTDESEPSLGLKLSFIVSLDDVLDPLVRIEEIGNGGIVV